ncbi:MAG: DsrE family protein [Gammaproteobacteria bacterium]|nr:DsrE family protein [Gammaproteobacteria bacterium]MDH5802538.1 DsrE family protein [Gammaproteobacteria bacterium]
MKLGILVTSDKYFRHVAELVQSASRQGHEVTVFCMDVGTRFLEQVAFRDLCKLAGVSLSLCRHSAEEQGVDVSELSKDIVCGSQFNNAMMNHESDHVLVF